MIVVIQCAAGKQRNAGRLRTSDERCVMFVANPDCAPSGGSQVYARPDDNSDRGKSWRTVLQEYNDAPEENPFGLLQAGRLYKDATYGMLMEKCGPERLYILSAGWGLIRSDYLTPDYDITFSNHQNVKTFKRRRDRDEYHDFSMLPPDTTESITFFGGKAYVRLFCMLTNKSGGSRYVWHNSQDKPDAPGCIVKRFNSPNRRRWYYECAQAFVQGSLEFGSG